MNDGMQRVGLVFKEDGAVDFKKTLQEINIELTKNYNQFKVTQSQWDNSTSKTKKLAEEQENLKNAYALQTDKIQVLKMQLSELESAEVQNTTAIKKKINEITKAEIKAENYRKKIADIESQLHNTGEKLENFGETVSNVGDKMEKAGKKLSVFSTATGGALVASAKSAIDFDDAFVGVEKTVDGTAEQMAALKQGIRDMAKEIPSSTTEIAGVAEAAGQLGIKTDDILSFTKVMIDLGNSTNLSAEEAASSLAKFANIMNTSADDYSRLGSTIVDLGNNFATTEADITSMAMRIAGAGKTIGLSEANVLSLATALSSVGIEAEMGGSAISKAMIKMATAVETNNEQLIEFAKVAGMSTEEFKESFERDAIGTITKFIVGLGDTESAGKSTLAMLEDLGFEEVRLRDTMLRAANASEVFSNAIELGNNAWKDNTALANEANKRYADFKSQIKIAVNKLRDLAITFGNKLVPIIPKVTKKIEELTNWVGNLNDGQVELILKIAGCITVLGPFLTILGKITSVGGNTVKAIGLVTQAIGVMKGTVTTTSTAVNGLAGVFSAITSPVGLACTACVASVAAISFAVSETQKSVKKDFQSMGDSASEFITGIDSAKSYLDKFNETLFVSSNEQEELSIQMKEVQDGITSICKTASDERRNYTQEEIIQLDEYFSKLRDLNRREFEIQSSISQAITQQAVTNAEAFKGNLEEYKVASQEWLKTAQEQKEKTIELINQQSIEEVALLNQRYGDQATMQNENYAREYNELMNQKQQKINMANIEVAEINEAYTQGYANRLLENDKFKSKIEEYNKLMAQETKRYNDEVKRIEDDESLNRYQRRRAKEMLEEGHLSNIKDINKRLSKNLSDTEAEQLGTLIGMTANTELYGGKIEGKTKTTVDNLINSYNSLPAGTRKAMKNAMDPMLEEMEKKEPTLLAKASSIANGIISKLMRAFDEHSPSKKTRKIMKFAMDPMEEEMENGKKELLQKSTEIAKGVNDRLSDINGDIDLKNNNSTSSPNINSTFFLDYERLEIILNNNYNKLINMLVKSLNSCKFTLDEDGFVRIVQEELLKVM